MEWVSNMNTPRCAPHFPWNSQESWMRCEMCLQLPYEGTGITAVHPVWKLWLHISCCICDLCHLLLASISTWSNFRATVQDLLAYFLLQLRDFIMPQWTIQFPNKLVYALSYIWSRRQIELSTVKQLLQPGTFLHFLSSRSDCTACICESWAEQCWDLSLLTILALSFEKAI